jgi:multidrug resistance efflux pump
MILSPKLRRHRGAIAAAAGFAALIALAGLRHREPPSVAFTDETVRRGPLQHVLHESGTLKPRQPVLVKCDFGARIQFLVEDGAWIEKGETLFVLSEDDEVKRVADERNNLLGVRQELRLATMKRQFADETEGHKAAAAKRAYALEAIRFRILTAKPVGGTELIRLHHELAPIEAVTAEVRKRFEAAQAAYQTAFDAHLDAVDAVQTQRDASMRVQARIDELAARVDVPPAGLNAAERDERERALKDLPGAREELVKLDAAQRDQNDKLAAARSARDAAKPAFDELQAQLSERERIEEDYDIRIEIEKRGLPLAKLRLDEEASALILAEAERKRDQGKLAFAAGALSKTALEDLEAAVRSAGSQLRIVRENVMINERPPAPEILVEAQTKLDRAKAKADQAQEAYQRALAIQDQEIAVLRAQERRWTASIESRSRHFPAMIEANIEFAEKELSALDQEDSKRRDEITAEILRMKESLDAAMQTPPNVFKAPVSGITWVMREGDRPRQAGDRAWEEDTLVEIYPPADMEVVAKVNEVNIKHVAKGMRAAVHIPSLADLRLSGDITQVSGIGKDKFGEFSDTWDKIVFADVTQFEVRCHLSEARQDYRQGMTALMSIVVSERPDVLWLPIGAVARSGDGWTALVGKDPKPVPVTGEPFGDDAFIIAAGLKEGDVVRVKRIIDR